MHISTIKIRFYWNGNIWVGLFVSFFIFFVSQGIFFKIFNRWNVACKKSWISTRVLKGVRWLDNFSCFDKLWDVFILGGYIWSSWMCNKWYFPRWWMFELCDCTVPTKYLHCGLWTIPTCINPFYLTKPSE